jgi:hypothetical protein
MKEIKSNTYIGNHIILVKGACGMSCKIGGTINYWTEIATSIIINMATLTRQTIGY